MIGKYCSKVPRSTLEFLVHYQLSQQVYTEGISRDPATSKTVRLALIINTLMPAGNKKVTHI